MAPLPLQYGHAPLPLKVNKLSDTLFSFANTFLISSKNPKYVQTVERPVAVIALWSIKTTWFSYCFANTSLINDDLPLPATPVTTVNIPSGISISTFFKLWRFAPLTGKNSLGIRGLSFIPIS